MRAFLLVLIRSLARFFQGCANALGTLGRAAAPAEGPLPPAAAVFSARSAGPPEDWRKRATPPPPAHWIAVVKARAPGFLGSTPAAARAGVSPGLAERPVPSPAFPEPQPRGGDLERVAGTFPAAEPVLPRRFGPVAAPVGSLTMDPSRGKAPSSTRILTFIEERPRRSPAGAQSPTSDADKPGSRAGLLEEAPEGSPLRPRRPRQGFPSHGDAPGSRPGSPEADPFPEAGRPVAPDEAPWGPLRGSDSAGPLGSSQPDSGRVPAVLALEEALRWPELDPLAVPGHPGSALDRGRSSSKRGAAGWPELPSSFAEREDLEDARLLDRELRRRAALEDEQRGIPWNA